MYEGFYHPSMNQLGLRAQNFHLSLLLMDLHVTRMEEANLESQECGFSYICVKARTVAVIKSKFFI